MNSIYGQLNNLSEIVLGIGSYNNIHGLLTLEEDILSMKILSEVITPNVVELILEYSDNNIFSLKIKDSDKYIGVKLEHDNNKITAYAIISDIKTYFSINYSSIDKVPRSNIFSGALYSLQTVVNNVNYTVSWKVNDLPNAELLLFLPLSWYENESCENKTGLIPLIENLNQLSFKGYTNEDWCKNVKQVIHCEDDQRCGNCLGHCDNISQICELNNDNNFVCITNDETTTNNNTVSSYTWLAIFLVIIIILFLWWSFS